MENNRIVRYTRAHHIRVTQSIGLPVVIGFESLHLSSCDEAVYQVVVMTLYPLLTTLFFVLWFR